VGQLRPGDSVRFVPVGFEEARARKRAQDALLSGSLGEAPPKFSLPAANGVITQIAAHEGQVAVTYRQAGDRYLLVEYGAMVLDLHLRFRVHALAQRLSALALAGVRELTPGIRSLQVHYDSDTITQRVLVDTLTRIEAELGDVATLSVPTRVLRLPLSWDDPQTQLAIAKYEKTVRADAPWTPSNIEFIRRINGLEDEQAVRAIVYGARYLVLGLGDVYLGAPVATPLDPRQRLVTTKYNPARTWTPENAVGIGGAYMCIYGMEGPGGYQFVGRTLQVFNRFRATREFQAGKPWLLRFFDQIQFYPVSADELLEIRAAFPAGRHALDVCEETFSVADYDRFLHENDASIAAFRAKQRAAFEAERMRWLASGQNNFSAALPDIGSSDELLPEGSQSVSAHVPGSVWKVLTREGQRVAAGDPLVILESMKMELTVSAPAAGKISRVVCREGQSVSAGQTLVALAP
ncbi:MAG TPA: carboxyltransferase domain-containing protein, partial [Polyangiales bacterium]|nr:carboxyltransferase domain-containing protein [Polyangiales bacterium]